ncbi:MAG: nucleotidyl transferase AbiEii/AbiGii toxin family protein [Parcubacteria group bacterium]|jgi:predicted nucleotidyltransferase component of viral defense system
MIIPSPKDAVHKAWLYRLLAELYDDPVVAATLRFKGGTCAAMLGWLDRFSVDLDFDYVGSKKELKNVRRRMEKIFSGLGLEIKDKSQIVPQYFLKYPVPAGGRNTLKIDTTFPPPKSNVYKAARFVEIDRIIICQTIETMFANKLVAIIDRWEKKDSLAGRDLYDIHHFFLQGYNYNSAVIEERRKTSVKSYLKKLTGFIEKKFTEKIITQDLNLLMAPDKFQQIRKVIKRETLIFLNDELKKI